MQVSEMFSLDYKIGMLQLPLKARNCSFPQWHLEARRGDEQVTLGFEKKQSISKLQSTWNNLPNYMEVIYSIFTFCFGLSNISSSHPQGQQLGLKLPLPAWLGVYYLTLPSPPRNRQGFHQMMTEVLSRPKTYYCCIDLIHLRAYLFLKLFMSFNTNSFSSTEADLWKAKSWKVASLPMQCQTDKDLYCELQGRAKLKWH